jgi:hypothetical protein
LAPRCIVSDWHDPRLADCDAFRVIASDSTTAGSARLGPDLPSAVVAMRPETAWHRAARHATRRWHVACFAWDIGTTEQTTMSNTATLRMNPLFLRHDLMIELGRLEMAIESARVQEAANDTVNGLESRCAKINEALGKLPA